MSDDMDIAESKKGINWLPLTLALIAASSIVGYLVYGRRNEKKNGGFRRLSR